VRVLITGANGQVGRALIKQAPAQVETLGCSHGDLDITDKHAVAVRVRQYAPDVIINAAAHTAVDRAEGEAELARRINADAPGYLAEAARDAGARLVHISTDFVFDGTSSVPYRTDAPTNPLGVYGTTKRQGEMAVLSVLPERSVVLRTAWVYAAEGSNFVRTMLRLMGANGTVRVIQDQVGTPTAARSVADIIWKIVESPAIHGLHHWTDAGVASWYDFAVAIAEEGAQLGLVSPEVTVIPIATDEYPTRARRPAYSVLDKRSLTSIGMLPQHWRRQLRKVLEEVKNG
jgi:dTDP-4-dehydrorhamnose reductase